MLGVLNNDFGDFSRESDCGAPFGVGPGGPGGGGALGGGGAGREGGGAGRASCEDESLEDELPALQDQERMIPVFQ